MVFMKLENQKVKPEVFGSWTISGIHETLFWPPSRSAQGRSRCATAAKKVLHETTYGLELETSGFLYYFFKLHETTKGFKCSSQNCREYHQQFPNKSMKPGHKNARFLF